MSGIYYYESFGSKSRDIVEEYIASNKVYDGEKGLLYLFENEIDYIDTPIELKKHCIKNDLNFFKELNKFMNEEELIEVRYRIFLPNTNEWIVATNDENIWVKGSYADSFSSAHFTKMLDLISRLSKEKNLRLNEDILLHQSLHICKSEYIYL